MRQFNAIFKEEKDLLALREQIASHSPKKTLLQVFYGAMEQRNVAAFWSRLIEIFPCTAILGASSSGEIVNTHVMEHAIVISASLFDHTNVSTALVDQNDDLAAAGTSLGTTLAAHAPNAVIVFGCGLKKKNFFDNRPFLKALHRSLGNIPIAGGQSGGYRELESRPFVFTEQGLVEGGFAAAALSGNKLCVHTARELGWVPIGKKMTVTRAQGTRLYRLDDKPANEIYRHYLGIEADHASLFFINNFPLMANRAGIQVTTPISSIYQDGSFELMEEINTGEQVQFSLWDARLLHEGAQRLGRFLEECEPEAVFVYTCIFRKMIFGEDISVDMDALKCCGNAVGFLTFGEYCTTPGHTPMCCQQTMTVLALSEADNCRTVLPPQLDVEINVSGTELRRFQSLKVMSHLVASTTRELEASNQELAELANKDGLTGLGNRRLFDETLWVRLKEHSRIGGSMSMLLMDVDFFKQFNDNYGHVAGDDCLRGVAQVLQREAKRPSDMAFRYGGEEFACILAFTNHQGAMNVAENIRSGVEGLAIAHERSTAGRFVTVSLGVLTIGGGNVLSPLELLSTCDELLYVAKERGRNRAVGRDLSAVSDVV